VQVAGLDAGASRARLPRWSVGAIGLGRSASRSYRVQVAGLDAGASTARLPRRAWEPSDWGALRPGLSACRLLVWGALRPDLTACRLLGRTLERPGRGYHAERGSQQKSILRGIRTR